MNGLDYRQNSIIYTDGDGEHFLIDGRDYLSNISRIPLHGPDEMLTSAKLVLSLMQKHDEYSRGSGQEGFAPYYAVIDSLVADFFIRNNGAKMPPIRLAQIGREESALYRHLKEMAYTFDPDTEFFSVTEPGDEDFSQFSGYFDIVVVDGSVRFEDPMYIIKYSKEILKKGGRLIIYAYEQPLLESLFCLLHENRQEFFFEPQVKIFMTEE